MSKKNSCIANVVKTNVLKILMLLTEFFHESCSYMKIIISSEMYVISYDCDSIYVAWYEVAFGFSTSIWE